MWLEWRWAAASTNQMLRYISAVYVDIRALKYKMAATAT